jgi:hypothetical protein
MNSLFTLVSGGLAGAVATLITQKVSEPLRVWGLSKNITATPQAATDAYRLRVCNPGKRTIEQAIAYISLKFDKRVDIVDGEESAFINVSVREELNEDRLCWSIAAPDPHPVTIDIYPGEKQALDLVRFHSDRIEIPSEQGWSDPKRNLRSRVLLRNGRYEGRIHIVAKNTLRRSFDLVIDASSGRREVTLSRRKFIRFFSYLMRRSITKD